MTTRWRRQPPLVQDACLAALLGIAWFGCAAYWKSRGWYPTNDAAYDLAGAAAVLALAGRRVAPSVLLAGGVLAYPVLYQQELQTEFHLLPVLLVAYAAARRSPGWAVAVAVAALTAGFLLASGVLHADVLLAPDPPRLRGRGPQPFGGAGSTYDWSRILFDEFAVAGMVVLGWVTATLAARNDELERLRRVEAERAVAVERTRIARELHDDVAHHLTALVVRAQAAERLATDRPEVAVDSVGWIAETARSALTSMRRTVSLLRDGDAAPLAPSPSLDDLAAIVARVSEAGLDVRVDVDSSLPRLEPQVRHAVVRVVQEALTNVLRHAGASVAVVSVQQAASGVAVTVEDDGDGADPDAVRAAGGGHGLVGMRERAASCGGRFGVDRSDLGGWRVRAWFPGSVLVRS